MLRSCFTLAVLAAIFAEGAVHSLPRNGSDVLRGGGHAGPALSQPPSLDQRLLEPITTASFFATRCGHDVLHLPTPPDALRDALKAAEECDPAVASDLKSATTASVEAGLVFSTIKQNGQRRLSGRRLVIVDLFGVDPIRKSVPSLDFFVAPDKPLVGAQMDTSIFLAPDPPIELVINDLVDAVSPHFPSPFGRPPGFRDYIAIVGAIVGATSLAQPIVFVATVARGAATAAQSVGATKGVFFFALLWFPSTVEGRGTGFKWGASGQNCDDACGTGLTCQATRQDLITSGAKLTSANNAVIAENGPASGKVCTNYGGSGSGGIEFAPHCTSSGFCRRRGTGTAWTGLSSLCSRSPGNSNSRLCCCTASGEDPSTLCPVEASDCAGGTVFEAATGRCLDPASAVCPRGTFLAFNVSLTLLCQPCPRGKYGTLSDHRSPESSACIGTCEVGQYGTSATGRTAAADVTCSSCPSWGAATLAGSSTCAGTPSVGWVFAKAGGLNCDEVCADDLRAETTCQVSRINAVTGNNDVPGAVVNSSKFMLANAAVKLDRGDAAGVVCAGQGASAGSGYRNTGSAYSSFAPLHGSDGMCVSLTSSASTCAANAFGGLRLCCCAAAGENPANMCPVSSTDCALYTTWNALTGTCVDTGIGCPAGHYMFNTACRACEIGKYGTQITPGATSEAVCADCAQGMYGALPGKLLAEGCASCSSGKFGSAPGQSTEGLGCAGACSSGRWSARNNLVADSQCDLCLPGSSTGAASAATACDLCLPGTFNSASSQSSCAGSCSKGRWSDVLGLVADAQCFECPSGKIDTSTDTIGKSTLDEGCAGKCSAGKHSDGQKGLVSDSQCVGCPGGRFSTASGVTTALDCIGVCRSGRYSNETGQVDSGSCVTCDPNLVSIPGKSYCRECLGGEFADQESATCTSCPANTYHFRSSEEDCTTCPAVGTECLDSQLQIIDKFWVNSPANTSAFEIGKETKLYPCANDESCLHSPRNARHVDCDISLGYFGPLCGACDRDNVQGHGTFTRSGRGCTKCWNDAESWGGVLGIALSIVLVVTYLVAHHSFAAPKGEYGATVQKIAMSYLQMLGVLGVFKAKGTAVFTELASRPAEIIGGSITSMLPIKCAMKSQIYGPFLLTMGLPFLLIGIASLLLIPKAWCEKKLRGQRIGKDAPVFKGTMNLPRWAAFHKKLRVPMTEADLVEWHDDFHPSERIAGVAVFVLFTLYPSLVASIASIYNCTQPIEGKSYLVVDLTVTCYDEKHIAFIVFASIGAAIFAVGIPTAVAFVVTLRLPFFREDGVLKFGLKRRTPEEYTSMTMRSRFAFLFNGYATDRSGVVVAWEAIVMVRKLAVTLAGSMIKDAYLQILVALLILVISGFATAFIQPYETEWLNLLDTIGLFALIFTQIFSIVYFYAAASTEPFLDSYTIEVAVTILLTVVNALVIAILFYFFGREMIGLRQHFYKKHRNVFAVASAEQAQAVGAGVGAAITHGQRWCHPDGIAVATAPKSATPTIWTWVDEKGVVSASMEPPTLLLPVESFAALPSGATFHWVHKKSGRFSAMQTKPRDVGGWVCGGALLERDRVVEEGDIEMGMRHENGNARDPALDRAGDGAAAVDDAGDGAPVGGDAPVVGSGAGALAVPALLAGERGTVAELQALLQERDAALHERDTALQERDAEITQLKEEIEAFRMQTSGAVVHLVVAADAPDTAVDMAGRGGASQPLIHSSRRPTSTATETLNPLVFAPEVSEEEEVSQDWEEEGFERPEVFAFL